MINDGGMPHRSCIRDSVDFECINATERCHFFVMCMHSHLAKTANVGIGTDPETLLEWTLCFVTLQIFFMLKNSNIMH